jgi:bifunctional UDP-N-acetylglucosamine pyrophosphorylase/glucosamine-1-phosphate N-acetyltransferase
MSSPHIVILAAGKGKRMRSALPKVLHPILFRPMIHYVLDTALALPHASLTMVVGHGEDDVRKHCENYPTVQFVKQEKQLGTADAVRAVAPRLAGKTGSLLLLSGDVMLLRPETLALLLESHAQHKRACTVTTAKVPDPTGYGRILRNATGDFTEIREHGDCTPSERSVDEVNSGIYCFEIADLFPALERIDNRNQQGEFYLTDVVKILLGERKKVGTFLLADPREMEGINDRLALSKVESWLSARINRQWMLEGVSIQHPDTVLIDTTTRIEPDVVIESHCTLIGARVSAGSYLESNCRIQNSEIGRDVRIKQGSYVEDSRVGEHCSVGPYAHLRPGTVLDRDVKIGNFVEVKKAHFAEGAKASHLSYIGDAEIGKHVNLGCGFITCNYDGTHKHQTVIEDHVFVGSDSQAVAPVTIGRGSYVAAGSTITDNVPAGSLALSRGRQVNKPNYKKKPG